MATAPVQLSGDQRALGPGVPLIHGLRGKVVVLPGAQYLIGAGVQVVRLVLS
jgi:hypothetical protein